MASVIGQAEKVIPNLMRYVAFSNSANPLVLNNWTMNFNGAAYGWAATVDQFFDYDFIKDNIIKNLFLCGHWSTIAQGVPGVSITGERVAKIILNSKNDKIK
jgi:phytoene dehydrogenase-like protein